jgi:hypothetical protein
MQTLEEREKDLLEREDRLIRKRKRDKIADMMVVIVILIITGYNSAIVHQANYICEEKCRELYLGINDKKWNITTNGTLEQAINRLNNINNITR